jgi:hypothetical protein
MDDWGVMQARSDGFSAVIYPVRQVLDLFGETLELPHLGTRRLGSRRSL